MMFVAGWMLAVLGVAVSGFAVFVAVSATVGRSTARRPELYSTLMIQALLLVVVGLVVAASGFLATMR